MSSDHFDIMPLPTERERELLYLLIEECAEVQQRATKMLRFGRDEVQRGQPHTNRIRLSHEIGDLREIIDRAVAADLVDFAGIGDGILRKREQLAKYMRSAT